MVGATRLPAGPTVRADPFVLRPLNNKQRSMMVGRQEIASILIDQMTHGKSGVHLIVGASGSGRTSLLNCLAPEDSRHIGNIWNEETKTIGVIHEAVAKFTNTFQIPPTPQSAADYLRRHLEGRTGNLDICAFDYRFIPLSEESHQRKWNSLVKKLQDIRFLETYAALRCADGGMVGQYEHTVHITDGGPEIMTLP